MIDWKEQPCGLHLMRDWHESCPICRSVRVVNDKQADLVAQRTQASERMRGDRDEG